MLKRLPVVVAASVFTAALVSVGCGGEGRTEVGSWAGTIDTVNGVVVVANPATPILHGQNGWRLEEELSIGVVEGDPDYQFAGIADVEIDEAGTIYVLDGRERRVAIYDSAGVFVTAFGRQGEGPGEFESPNKLLWEADTLVVWDGRLRRLSYFDRKGNLLRDERAELPMFTRFELRPDGRVWAQQGPTYWWPMRPGVDGVGNLVVMGNLRGQGADTLLTWEDQSMVPVRFEQGLTVVPRWYAPRVDWASDAAGRLFIARGEGYEIEVYSPAGQRIATIRRDYARFPPSSAERDTARAWLEEAAPNYGPNADRVRKAFEIVDLKQATGKVVVSDDNHVWVQTFTEDDASTQTWNIFDPGWRYVSAVELPNRLSIHRITEDHVYGEFEDELEVPYVKRYAIRKPAR